MMSGVAVKQEMIDLPTKTIVTSSNGNESITSHIEDESRGDNGEVKREGDTNDRDRNNNAFVYQNHHKKMPSSPAAQSKMVSSSAINNAHQHHNNRYYRSNPSNPMSPNLPGNRGVYPPLNRGYGGHPPYNYPGGNFGPPPQQYHNHHSHMMPPYNNGPHGGAYPGPPVSMSMKPNYHPSMPYGAPGSYGIPPQYPPHHGNGMNHNYHNMNLHSDSNSISSKSSINSKKKRTIEGIHNDSSKISSAYNFRRTDSNSTTSTVTAGNNVSIESQRMEPSLHIHSKASNSEEGRSSNSDQSLLLNNHHKVSNHRGPEQRYHRRDYSAASTASSLSAGGFSLSSYERVAVGLEDAVMRDNLQKSTQKRHKKSSLVIDTGVRNQSSLLQPLDDTHDQSSRFEHMSIEEKTCSSTDSNSSAGHSNLFLSLSTSPINADVDATPNVKNTAKERKIDHLHNPIFKLKDDDKHRPSDTPTPPVHGELGDSEMMNDDHSMLNQHLRGQSFTPLHHLTKEGSGTSPSNTVFASAIAPQLSWSVAGDTPSIGDLADWEDEGTGKMNNDPNKSRPGSTTSTDTRNMMISPHDFQMWKEEHELIDHVVSGNTTPLPVFFEQSGNEQSENQMRFENDHNKGARPPEQMHMMYGNGRKPHEHQFWPKHDEICGGPPPNQMYSMSDYRDNGFTGHSPMHGDRRDLDFHPSYPHHPGSNDRIRNLRGRVPHGSNFPPMPLHIPHHISSHLPMTSPMGLGPGKQGMWSPHHGMGMPLGSPHHLGSPMSHMAQSKRKCVSLKPPIPSKFQGDMEKMKSAPVPEFTSLVNFPAHMSQKQSVNLPEGMRCCVMCGNACPCSNGNKGKKCKSSSSKDGGLAPHTSNGQDHLGDKNSGYAIIPSQNKGLCTLCDVNVWVVAHSGLEIKWCKGCKNFRPWAAFGDKGLATKCLRCRERQREKYALQKEEKEKIRVVMPTKTKK